MRAKIVRIIWKNPNATTLSISKEINIASRNVQKHLRKLQEQGVIRRIGPDKGGTEKNRTIVFEGKKTPRRQIEETRINEERIIVINVILFFASCGGLDLGFEQAGFRVVWANEFEPSIHATYEPKSDIRSQKVSFLLLLVAFCFL